MESSSADLFLRENLKESSAAAYGTLEGGFPSNVSMAKSFLQKKRRTTDVRFLEACYTFLVPLAVFLMGTVAWVQYYSFSPWAVAITAICGAVLMTLSHLYSTRIVTVLLGLAVVAGLVCGCYIYFTHTVFYYHYSFNTREYTNVQVGGTAAAKAAALYSDAGAMLLTPSAQVDRSSAVGYKSIYRGGQVFCAAPVVDPQAPIPATNVVSTSGVYAVGIDCCEQRGSFKCDDSSDSSAHGGVRLVEWKSLLPGWVAWAVGHRWAHSDTESYLEAITLQNAVFGQEAAAAVTTPEVDSGHDSPAAAAEKGTDNVVLLRWLKNPQSWYYQYWYKSVDLILTSAAGFFAAELVVVFLASKM